MHGRGGNTKRKAGIHLDFDKLLGKDDEPIPEMQILRAAETSMPQAEMVSNREEVDRKMENTLRRFEDKDLLDRITRDSNFLKQGGDLKDGGEKLKSFLVRLEAEADRRGLYKDNKCKRVKTLADGSTCTGLTNDLSHSGAPPSKPACLSFCNKMENDTKMENDKATRCFGEELHTLNQSDPQKVREHKPYSPQIIKQKKGLSSRQEPFKSPSHLPVNIDSSRKRNYGEQRGIHAYDISPHPSDKGVSCCFTKKEGVACCQLPFNSRRSNKTVVLDLVDEEEVEEIEELEVNVMNKADQVDQSSKNTRIYYPSRDDPVAMEICYSDMDCLAPESYLSSPIMNFYIRYLQNPTSPSAKRKYDYHIFNTYFYEKLKQDVLTKSFRRWWKDVNLFEKAYILLPIHENAHWSLVIICMPNKEDGSGPIVLHLDSLGLHMSKTIFSNVKSFLIEARNILRQETELPEPHWKIDEKVIEVPQQKNEYDCGLFVLYFMQRFIVEAPERLKKQDLEMFGRQWFKPEEASSLRSKIRNLLREEFKNANEDICEVQFQS